MSGGGAERERDTPKIRSRLKLQAVSIEPNEGLESTNRDQDLSPSWRLN